MYDIAAPTGAPRRRWVHRVMHALRQGSHPHGASAPSAGVCHRCVTHRPGAHAAERSGALGAVAIGRHRGMRRKRGRSRAAAAQLAGTGASRMRTGTERHRHIPPSCVTRSTPSPANGYGCGCGPRLAQFRPRFFRPLQLQRKVRYASIHRPYFSAVFRHRRLSPSPLAYGGSRAASAHLRARRRRRYVDAPTPIGTVPAPPVRAGRGPRAGGPGRPTIPSRSSPTPRLPLADLQP